MTTAALDRYWSDLVTVALLGTDRRDPPEAPAGLLADLIDDTLHEAPVAADARRGVGRRRGAAVRLRRRPAVRPARAAGTRPAAAVFHRRRVDLEVRRGRMAGTRGRVGAHRDRAWVAAATRRTRRAPHPAPHRRHPARPRRDRRGIGGAVGDRARSRVGATDIGAGRRRRRVVGAPARRPSGARRPPRRRCPHVRVDAAAGVRRRTLRCIPPRRARQPVREVPARRCSTKRPRHSPPSIRCRRRPAWRWRSPISPAHGAGCWSRSARREWGAIPSNRIRRARPGTLRPRS